MDVNEALAWAAENADRHGPVDALVAEVRRLRAIEQRARTKLVASGPADLHAREVAREILGGS